MDEILGRPYVWGTAGPGTFTCYGVYLYLLQEVAGVVLPHRHAPNAIRAVFNCHEPVSELEPMDVLYLPRVHARPGVWTVLDGKWTVTATQLFGVHRVELAEVLREGAQRYRYAG